MTNIENLDASRRLQLLVDGVVDYAIYLVGTDGRVLSWNTGAQRLKGYTAAEIVGRPFASFFTEEDRRRELPERALAAAASEGRFETEGWRVRKDGTRFWASGVIDAIYDDHGALVGYAKITRDITERREVQQQLHESEQRFRRLVNAVVDYAIFQLDESGVVTTWNSGAERIKGYSPEEIIGQHFSVFYTLEDQQAGVPENALASSQAVGRYHAEGWRVRKDGTRFWASVVIDPIRADDGRLMGFAKVTRDITERMDSERILKEVQEQLAASQKMEAIGQLSGGIAHDFNNLLMIVVGNLETAQRQARSVPNPNLARALTNAMRGAQRAATLTARLLAFSRRQPLNPKPLDVNRFLTSTVDFLQRSLGERIEVEVVGAAGVWPVEVDRGLLESAFVNLAINGRDAMPDGGKLTLEAANIFADEEYCRLNPEINPGQYVVLCVSDTGAGMTPEVLSRAFEPFFTTKDPGHGTGLGLSQVYGFVKQSGGHIKLYSEVGEGTTVKIYLPRLKNLSQSIDDDEGQTDPQTGTGETILLVEDDEDVRAYLVEVLREHGYRVMGAADGKRALDVVKGDVRVDLLLTDVVMKGINGRELANMAQQMRPGLPVLYMTGYSRNAIVHQGRLEDGVEVIQKPILQSELTARIRAILDRSK